MNDRNEGTQPYTRVSLKVKEDEMSQQSDYQQMQTHTDMLGVRDALTHLDKRVSVLEVRQGSADEHLRELKTDVKEIGNEVKNIGKDLSERITKVGHNFHAHTEQEDKDRIELIRKQKNIIITSLLTLAAVSTPYVIEFLRSPIAN